MALRPVCSGSCTDLRCMTPGACSSRARRPSVSMLAEAVDRLAQRVDDAAEVAVADGDREHLTGTADLLALLDAGELAQDDDTDLADVEVLREAERAVLEAQQLVRHRARKALDLGDAVARRSDDAADLLGRPRPGARRTSRSCPARPGSRPAGSSAQPLLFSCRGRAKSAVGHGSRAVWHDVSWPVDAVRRRGATGRWSRRRPRRPGCACPRGLSGSTVTLSCTGLPYERSRSAPRRCSCCAGEHRRATSRRRRGACDAPPRPRRTQPSVCTKRRPRSDDVARRARLWVTASTLPPTSASTTATRRSGAVVVSERTCLASRWPTSARVTRNSSSSTRSSVPRASAEARTASDAETLDGVGQVRRRSPSGTGRDRTPGRPRARRSRSAEPATRPALASPVA